MGKILIIRGADFSQVAIGKVNPDTRIQIIVAASPAGGGTVTGGGLYEEGEQVVISATAAVGYQFSQWSDGDTNTTRTITVGSASKTYTAVFVERGWETIEKTYTDKAAVTIASVAEAKQYSKIHIYVTIDLIPAEATTKRFYFYVGYGQSYGIETVLGTGTTKDVVVGTEYDLGDIPLSSLQELEDTLNLNFSNNYLDDSIDSWEKLQVAKKLTYTLRYKFG